MTQDLARLCDVDLDAHLDGALESDDWNDIWATCREIEHRESAGSRVAAFPPVMAAAA